MSGHIQVIVTSNVTFDLCLKRTKCELVVFVGEKPFACNLCERAFTRSDELARHKRSHTGEKNHMCPYCEQRFTRKDHLTKHIKRLH